MSWPRGIGRVGFDRRDVLCALVVAVFYFAAARVGLALMAQPQSVAIFWPASGFAAGALIFLGSRWRGAIGIGVFAATVAANLLGDRNEVMAVVFGLCNAGEALLFAWMIEARFGPHFEFSDLRATAWFFVAAGVSAATMAVLASATIKVVANPTASFFDIWAAWWESDAVGIIVLAPFLITLGHVMRTRPPMREILEGSVVIVLIAVFTATNIMIMPGQYLQWLPFPVAGLFPLFLWLGARCGPAFTTTALLMVALVVVGTMTQGVGRLANPDVPFEYRVFAARISLALVAFSALMLITIIAERRSAEARVRFLMNEINHRSNNLLAIVQAIALRTGRTEEPAQFASSFSQRIAGLAASNDLLVANSIGGVAMVDLMRSQLSHLSDLIGTRIQLRGPPLRLKPDAAQVIGMALHELATNAVKYGALANEAGTITIEWTDGEWLMVRWTELGGKPILDPPLRRGFGQQVLVDMARHQLDATVRLDYPKTGLIWELTVVSERVRDTPRFAP